MIEEILFNLTVLVLGISIVVGYFLYSDDCEGEKNEIIRNSTDKKKFRRSKRSN